MSDLTENYTKYDHNGTNERGTLKPTEPHPGNIYAIDYIFSIQKDKLMRYQGSLSSCAIEGNRLAEVCAETLRRLLNSEPVSDRYIMGLAWALYRLEEKH